MSITRFRHVAPISIIVGFALALRLWRLNLPKGYIFDEVYYAKNAASLITDGVELNEQGAAEFVVHPPLGKWLIGIGIKLFGNNEFGWRVIAAIVGSASILLIYLIVQRLFNSLFLSNIAAALFALDGLHLVMSRVALLDIFLMFFIMLTFYLILRDNLWLSGVVIGFAAATKWSALFVIPFLILLTVNIGRANFATWGKRFSQFVLAPIGIYLLSWSGWFLSAKGWARDSGSNLFSSLWNYHVEIMNFHRGLTEQHTYAANPWSWLVLGRPTSFYYESTKNCGAQSCSQEIWQLAPQFCGGLESSQLQSRLDYSSSIEIEFQPSFLLALPAPIYLGFSFKIEPHSIFMQSQYFHLLCYLSLMFLTGR